MIGNLLACDSFASNNLSAGFVCFQLGLFLLPSSALLSAIFFLIALFLSSVERKENYFSDYWNYPLLLIGVLMIISAFNSYTGWLAWIGLANWIPFFWCFWGFQPYLMTSSLRKKCSSWLLAGTLPVILTGLGQILLGWEGPWQLFDGLIVWFVAPGGEPIGRLSGLFDYANIAAAWLAVIWPLSLANLFQPFVSVRNRVIYLLLAILVVISLILTQSRNAWGGLILAVPLVLGQSSWFWLLPLMIFCAMPVFLAIWPGMSLDVQLWARSFVPESIWMRLNDMQFADSRPIEATRIYQWKIAVGLIAQRPLLGWGAAAFSVLYPIRTGIFHGHSHNLPLEVALSHGVLVSILLNSFVLCLLVNSLFQCFLVKNFKTSENVYHQFIERAWWASAFTLLCFYASDIPFFDSRINMIGWILLVGLRCISITKKDNQYNLT